MENYKK